MDSTIDAVVRMESAHGYLLDGGDGFIGPFNSQAHEATAPHIPEPSTLVIWTALMIVAAGAGLVWRRRRGS